MSRSQKFNDLLKENDYNEDYQEEMDDLDEEEKAESAQTEQPKDEVKSVEKKTEKSKEQMEANKLRDKVKKVKKRVPNATNDEIESALLMFKLDVLQAISYLQKNSKKEQKKKEVERTKSVKEEDKKEGKKVIEIIPIELLNAPIPIIQYKSEEIKSALNVVVIGHVDSGKSTMMGHLLMLLGEVDEHTVSKYKTEAKSIGKATFEYAWVMDEGETERSKGVTINIAKRSVTLKNKQVNFIDAPGHKDFVVNMINGATQADVAILVIDSVQKSFESGYLFGGQTKEHARIVKCLGVKKVIVAINKMDLNSWKNAI